MPEEHDDLMAMKRWPVERSFLYYHILMQKLGERIKNRPSESIVIAGVHPDISNKGGYRLLHRQNDGIETNYINIMPLTPAEALYLNEKFGIHHLYGDTIRGH